MICEECQKEFKNKKEKKPKVINVMVRVGEDFKKALDEVKLRREKLGTQEKEASFVDLTNLLIKHSHYNDYIKKQLINWDFKK